MKIIFSICSLLLLTLSVNAQNITVKGTVINDFDKPVSGVSVKVKGDTTEVYTDSTGFYSINVPPNGRLIFSKDFFKKKTKSVKKKKNINVALKYDLIVSKQQQINTGYGKINKSESTIATSTVDEKLIEKEQYLDFATLLTTVPGVSVTDEGNDLRIRIRGDRSLNSSNDPLIILNSSPYSGSLKNLNPRDIKSIDVLKGGAATAAYGSRGANGVIIITTK
ncbi:TonB-dependent receptor plug domain-containing protein [Flaviramulus sp. BrNp1-15]|uniref:TonB-dependent receptor plug domain-containing protein n=1 Tax=Flaviramulus sp. BrNp1-15 TaxID=2916754 RepID=UPI001EE785E5|nr:TonB-dependent receptor plug domain-containing protein [Flaviramulus sp. BrNp1-15]ULC58737.1 TonB-dependent receptor plug domain-containing protein [Flaviramulus sp. BrNp1-15]